MAGRRAGRRGRADADDQARARSAEFAQPRQDLRAVMAAQAEPLASSNARLTAPATLVPQLLLALVATLGFTALGSFGPLRESAKSELGLTDDDTGSTSFRHSVCRYVCILVGAVHIQP